MRSKRTLTSVPPPKITTDNRPYRWPHARQPRGRCRRDQGLVSRVRKADRKPGRCGSPADHGADDRRHPAHDRQTDGDTVRTLQVDAVRERLEVAARSFLELLLRLPVEEVARARDASFMSRRSFTICADVIPMPSLGHKSIAEAERYTGEANQVRLSAAAVARLPGGTRTGLPKPGQPALGKRRKIERRTARRWRSQGDSNPCFRRERATS